MIPYSRQTIKQDDINAIQSTLKSKWLTTGPAVEKFETAIASYTNARFSVAVSSGTAALHTACFAAGINSKDEVITTPYSFAATANCTLYCDGTPIFTDINHHDFNINTNKIKNQITKKTKAIIAVDFAGFPANWTKLKQIAKKNKLILIADAAHSFGAEYQNKKIGTLADLTCFSFHPVKTITTGEGGIITTNNKKLYQKMKMFRNHGIVKNKKSNLQNQKPWHYNMKTLGFNYRLTDIQCALGLTQLKKTNQFLKKRSQLANRYNQQLAKIPHLSLPIPQTSTKPSWHLYPLKINFNALGKTKSSLFAYMKKNNISLQVHYIPIHLHPYYRKKFNYKKDNFPIAEKAYKQEVSLPLYPLLTYSDQDHIIKCLKNFILKS